MQERNADWRLVPPLRTSNREGVAVFYRSARLRFSGPFRWSGGANGQASPVNLVGAPYPEPLNFFLGEKSVPNGSRYNAGKLERVCAAQTTHWNAYTLGQLPQQFQPRQPYLTTFAEVTPGGAFIRDIGLCSVHAPADPTASAYMKLLTEANEIVEPPRANEVRVLAGDFNVNLINTDGELTVPYKRFLQDPAYFRLGLAAPQPPPNFPAAARGYYATHIKRRKEAQFWPPAGAVYPGYGYIGSGRVANFFAIDNILTRGGNPANFTILNPVVGSPFTAYLPAPANAPIGAIQVNRRGGIPVPGGEPPQPGPVANPAQWHIEVVGLFRGWNNYGRIVSTSDHLPIAMDV